MTVVCTQKFNKNKSIFCTWMYYNSPFFQLSISGVVGTYADEGRYDGAYEYGKKTKTKKIKKQKNKTTTTKNKRSKIK